MLVPVFIMYFKHQRSITQYNRNLAIIQAKRQEDALRIAQLAREAPEKLTRAERAAVEGKIAWRDSVTRWQAAKKLNQGSVGSVSFSTRSPGESPGIKWDKESGSSLDQGGDLEMAVTERRQSSSSAENTPDIYVAGTMRKPIFQVEFGSLTQARRAQYRSTDLIPLQDLASMYGLATSPGATDIHIDLGTNGNSASTPQRSTTAIVDTAKSQSTVSTNSEVLTAQKLPPTVSYGFHLPCPQAGQAYTMKAKPEVVGVERLSPKDIDLLQQDASENGHLVLDTRWTSPVQLAVHSPSSLSGGSGETVAPVIVPHVPRLLQRRSAHVRRAGSGSFKLSTNKTSYKRSSSERQVGIPHVSTGNLQELPEITQTDPSWHQERMKRLQTSVSMSDLPRMYVDARDGETRS